MFIVFPELKPQFPSCLVIISSLNLVKELSETFLAQRDKQFFPVIIKMMFSTLYGKKKRKKETSNRDADNNQEPRKIPGCQRDFCS